MDEIGTGLVEIRFFTVRPGDRAEFDRISREETIPLMRSLGITVLRFGPALNDDDSYLLIRAFDSEDERVAKSRSLYESPEWIEKYDEPVGGMILAYRTVVAPGPLTS
jgi:hypothetical protein